MCHAHARPCLSTGWALHHRFGLTSGTAAVLAQGGGGAHQDPAGTACASTPMCRSALIEGVLDERLPHMACSRWKHVSWWVCCAAPTLSCCRLATTGERPPKEYLQPNLRKDRPAKTNGMNKVQHNIFMSSTTNDYALDQCLVVWGWESPPVCVGGGGGIVSCSPPQF